MSEKKASDKHGTKQLYQNTKERNKYYVQNFFNSKWKLYIYNHKNELGENKQTWQRKIRSKDYYSE